MRWRCHVLTSTSVGRRWDIGLTSLLLGTLRPETPGSQPLNPFDTVGTRGENFFKGISSEVAGRATNGRASVLSRIVGTRATCPSRSDVSRVPIRSR